MQTLVSVIGRAATLTFQELLLMAGPILGMAFILGRLSRYIRNRLAWMLRIDAYSYLTAPGVAVHELGHAFFCIVFRHRIVKIKLFQPEKDGTLGYVQHAYNPASTYQKFGNFFIGTGPIWFGTAAVYLLSYGLLANESLIRRDSNQHTSNAAISWAQIAAMFHDVGNTVWAVLNPVVLAPQLHNWMFWVGIYLVFCIGSHITLSRPDVNGAARGFLLFLAAVLLFNLLAIGIGERFTTLVNARFLEYLVILYASALFILAVNLCVAGFAGAFYRVIRLGHQR